MKVVQINAVYGISSTGRTSQEMHEYLLHQGVESHVFFRSTNSQNINLNKVGNIFCYRIHGVLSRLFSMQGYGSVLSTLQLVRQLKRINPDIVMLRNLHENYINLPILLRYLSSNNINVILVLHDCWFYTGGCTFYSYNGCNKWQEGCGNCLYYNKNKYGKILNLSKFNLKVKKSLFSKIKNLYVVGVSDWSVREAKASFLRDCARGFFRIYNWIDHEKFYPLSNNDFRSEKGIDKDAFLVACAAQNWNEKKGAKLLPRIAAALPDTKFVVIGEYKTQPTSNMICLGKVNDVRQLASAYSAADIFLNLSQEESFGKVSAEAMSCGTPIVTNLLTANPEIMGLDDFIVKEYNAEEYVKAIKKQIENRELLRDYAEQCFRESQLRYNLDTNMQVYIDLFNTIIRGR